MKHNGQLTMDIQDWIDYIYRKELIVTTRDEMLQVGIEHSPQVAAIAGIVSRHLEHAPDDILKPNRDLLQGGAVAQIYIAIRNMRTQIELSSGKEITVSLYNKPPAKKEQYSEDGDDSDDDVAAFESETVDALLEEELIDRSYAEAGSDRYYDNAVTYLDKVVPGHIYNRLAEIAACGGDVRKEADNLVDKIDAIVDRLLEPVI